MQKARSALILGSTMLVLVLAVGGCRERAGQALPVPVSTVAEIPERMVSTGTVTVPSVTPIPTLSVTDEPVMHVDESVPEDVESNSWYETIPADEQFPQSSGYALVLEYPAILYKSAEDAVVNGEKKRTLPGDEIYISYSDRQRVNGVTVYEVEEGGWISGTNLQLVNPSEYQGILINDMPPGGFGWLVNDAFSYCSENAPDVARAMKHYHRRYALFAVLETYTEADGDRWFRIGEDEWLRDEDFSYVTNSVPEGRTAAGGRWIEVNLSEQYLVVFENTTPIYAALVSTGKERGWTAAGIFTIYSMVESHGLLSPDPNIGNYYLEDVPYILFYQGSWALHGAYWHDAFGRPNSHGCVNLSLADARWLFTWAKAGDWVFLNW